MVKVREFIHENPLTESETQMLKESRADAAEIKHLKELLNEADTLLYIARAAASKLNTMYIRNEVEPRSELDALIGIRDQIMDWRGKKRGDEPTRDRND